MKIKQIYFFICSEGDSHMFYLAVVYRSRNNELDR